MATLPVDQQLPDLISTLASHTRCLLQAAPGAGKTTRVPPALLDQPWLQGRKIILLEPRRLAARSAARYMASQLNQRPGGTIGYRLRLDSACGPDTRIEVVTEGILTRMIQDDPALETVGCLIFDEYHERSLQADLGLALALESQQLFREDLRLLIMTATPDSERLQQLLGAGLPIISSEGRSFPVKTEYLGGELNRPDIDTLVSALLRAVAENDGSILCFLPGTGEIRRTQETLGQQPLPANLEVIPLYGALSPEQQDRAIKPSPPGARKLVLATDIAESSLTIDGVSVVVDAGLSRKPRFDPRSGMSQLKTAPISRASADQRRGRAGRQQPGRCYRLWSEHRQQSLPAHSPAEIVHADLAPLVLELARWGAAADELSWTDAPPEAHLSQARELLIQLEALDGDGRITPMGETIVALGTHPRLAHMMLKATELRLGRLACDLAALLGEKDLLNAGPGDQKPADIRIRLDHYYQTSGRRSHHALTKRIRATSERWQRQLGIRDRTIDTDLAGLLLSFAFPDRIARQRADGSWNYHLRNGRGAAFISQDSLCNSRYLVIADLDGQQNNARIWLAAPVEYRQLTEQFADAIEERTSVSWNADTESVRARRQTCLGALILAETAVPSHSQELVTAGLLSAIRQQGLERLPWPDRARSLRARILLARQYQPDQGWPDVSGQALLDNLENWLAPYIEGCRSFDQLQRIDLFQLLLNMLDWQQQQRLGELLPERFQVPSGSSITIDYLSRQDPQLAVRIQELFGLHETPTLLQGRLPLTVQLLSPARRPIQVTRDLASFWHNTYAEVCKDLKGRYPKHYWPDDPFQAQATRGTKKQMNRSG